MRVANSAGRLTLVVDGGGIDVATASNGRFLKEPSLVFDQWAEFCGWAAEATGPVTPLDEANLLAPSPRPRQVFSIGANYPDHAEEADFELPEVMEVFSKFPSALAGPNADVPLPKATIDWEAELVVVIGAEARNVRREDAWLYVAGVTGGQDFSERERQMAASQWGLAKSYPNFGPIGPWLVTPDEFDDPDDILITCTVNGEVVQKARTSRMIYSVRDIIAELSEVCTLYPGDVIFTGTMAGVGFIRKPPRYLSVGDVVVTEVDGVGRMQNRMVSS